MVGSRADEFISGLLSHASTRYYDPVKAREYYLRTRELKGRQRGQLKTDKKKQAWDYAKSEIDAAKKKDLTEAASIDQARKNAEQRRAQIREKLNVLLERLTNTIDNKIDALPPIPKGLSPEEAAKAAAERKEEIAKIRGDKTSARASAKSELEAVRGELRSSIETAQTNYKALKESLKAKYETESQQEFEAIKQNV